MNRKQLILVLAVVVVVGGLGLWLRSRQVASYRTTQGQMGQKVLGDFDLNAVVRIAIKQGTNQMNLVKQDEQWQVAERGNYPANFSEVSELLRKLWELKVVQPVKIGPSQLARLEFAAQGTTNKVGTRVDLQDKDGKAIKSVLLGKKHMRQSATPSQFGGDDGWPDGRYVMLADQIQTASLVSEAFSNAEPKPEQWLNKDFFKIEKVRSASVTYTNATNSWKLARETETGELKLVDAKPEEKLDSSKASGIPTSMSYPSFNDVAPAAKPEDTGLDNPTVAVFETFDNFTYTVRVGKQSGDNYHLTVSVVGDIPKERTPGKDEKAEDKEKLDKEFKEKVQRLSDKLKQEQAYSKTTYLVSKWTVDSLLKERHALMAEKKEENKGETKSEEKDKASAPVLIPDSVVGGASETTVAPVKIDSPVTKPKPLEPEKAPLPPPPPGLDTNATPRAEGAQAKPSE